MYIPKHFVIQEYVPKRIFEKWGLTAWEFMDDRLLMMDDALWEKFGPIVINNWHTNGDRQWSGLRTADSPFYSETSQHTFGRASDKIFLQHTAEEVRQYILANPQEFPFIRGVELGTSWVHSDCRNSNLKTFTGG